MPQALGTILGLDASADHEAIGRFLRARFADFAIKYTIEVDPKSDAEELWTDLARAIDSSMVQQYTARDVLEDAEAAHIVESSFAAERGDDWAAFLRPYEKTDPWTVFNGFVSDEVMPHLEAAGVYTEWGDFMRARAEDDPGTT